MYELILRCGSCGPGIMPASIMFSSLYLKARGKFMMVNKINPSVLLVTYQLVENYVVFLDILLVMAAQNVKKVFLAVLVRWITPVMTRETGNTEQMSHIDKMFQSFLTVNPEMN